jgi:peptidoglycan/LPS O-acetylase OafA/YrhL
MKIRIAKSANIESGAGGGVVSKSGRRNSVVDCLRGISILLVLLLHFHLTYHLNHGFFEKFFSSDVLKSVFGNGNYGVVMFFVISGFLITSTTLKRFGELKDLNLRDFYAFRFGRVAPNIILMLLIIVPLALGGVRIFQNDANGPSLWITVLSVLTFTHNWLMEKYDYFNYCLNIIWSLSVEEVFYFTFPIACLLLKKTKFIAIAWAMFLFISPYYRYIHRNDTTDVYGLYDYLACFDGLAIGCLVAIFAKSYTVPRWVSRLRLGAGILIAFICYQGIWTHLVFGISAVSLLTGFILLGAQDGQESRQNTRILSPLTFLGKYSYELYLFHIILLAFMRTAIKEKDLGLYQKPLLLLAFLSLSSVVAFAISRFYSEPLNKRLRSLLATGDAESSQKRNLSGLGWGPSA